MRLLSQLLFITRQHLWIPKTNDRTFETPGKQYICHAAAEAWNKGKINGDELWIVQNFIQDKIFPNHSYGGFMMRNYGIRFLDEKEEQVSRVHWLDQISQDLRREGK
jgi:hypothetical protein